MTGPTKGLGLASATTAAGGSSAPTTNGTDAGIILDMEEEVASAYELVKRIDILDVSVEGKFSPFSLPRTITSLSGTEIWVFTETAYNERVSRVENQIISRLRDRLGTARNANEMFRVFSKFNALFVRPKVPSLICFGDGFHSV